MAKRGFLSISDLTGDEVVRLFDLAVRMKRRAYRETPLSGKTLAMIFAKSSPRTRVSFEVGAYQLGGQALFLSSRDIQLGRGEPIADTARVLSRYVDGIMIRTFDHTEVLELARHATIPVINGLTDLSHPCQVLARSEEHTSELQSPCNLVCRLLLEKKKKNKVPRGTGSMHSRHTRHHRLHRC